MLLHLLLFLLLPPRWGPIFIQRGLETQAVEDRLLQPSSVPFIFGVVTMMSGVVGVPLGMLLSTKLKPRCYFIYNSSTILQLLFPQVPPGRLHNLRYWYLGVRCLPDPRHAAL